MRLFVGAELGEDAKDLIGELIDACRHLDLPARYEAREKQHLTIAFLGVTEDDRLPQVCSALCEAAAACEPFALRFDDVGAFPSKSRPRLLWLGSSDENVRFAACARRVRAAFQNMGWAFREEPIAHVTFCRCRRPFNRMPALAVAAPVLVRVRELALFQSIAAGGSTRYEVRFRATLGRP